MENDWVLDLDVRAFFDSLDHRLMMRALGRYTDSRWIHLYVERWLKAPVPLEDGTEPWFASYLVNARQAAYKRRRLSSSASESEEAVVIALSLLALQPVVGR